MVYIYIKHQNNIYKKNITDISILIHTNISMITFITIINICHLKLFLILALTSLPVVYPSHFMLFRIPGISSTSLPMNHTSPTHSIPYTSFTLLDAQASVTQCFLNTIYPSRFWSCPQHFAFYLTPMDYFHTSLLPHSFHMTKPLQQLQICPLQHLIYYRCYKFIFHNTGITIQEKQQNIH